MIVVDASAVVDALTLAPATEELRHTLSAEDLHAPQLIDFEVVSAIRGLTLGGHLSPARAEDALTDYAELPIQRWPSDGALRLRSFQLRQNLSAYDAAYVVLAEALDCHLVTRDGRLARSTGHDVRIRTL
ncbi:type II toxin-antitoxin system VapC family toxin [Branchiibius sp. NY16-3462-2]|uniref:type II toxin-antitoxin system VapC family toxin n=1 Tax=Branchiibius sp. NY16-3462-2 TaxID=1807500 RepID=UPI0007960B89|nr:type II toxin-antitoxin system VapC family toxin [Branchiibius sp. NY16-3462-2]KYH43447.1 PIN domain-containing protein [Branchiibius sp. NY16-3462-2]